MTEKELRIEATMTVEWKCTPMIDRPTFINGYITSAEPREKRITELEEQIEKMKCCQNCKKFNNLSYDCTCAEVCNEWELRR